MSLFISKNFGTARFDIHKKEGLLIARGEEVIQLMLHVFQGRFDLRQPLDRISGRSGRHRFAGQTFTPRRALEKVPALDSAEGAKTEFVLDHPTAKVTIYSIVH